MVDFVKIFIYPLLIPVLVGIGASAITSAVLIGRLEERVSFVELRAAKHEQAIEYLRNRTEEQEQHLTRFEAGLEDIREIKGDLKTLLQKK